MQKPYKNYHGSDEGFNDLVAAAKARHASAGLQHQERQRESRKRRRKEAADAAAKNPELTLWKTLKAELTGANGANYFDIQHEGREVPTLKGKWSP